MKTSALFLFSVLLFVALSLASCGVKPKHLESPSEDSVAFPRDYPSGSPR